MQTKERIGTFLPADGYWIMMDRKTGNFTYSRLIADTAAGIDLQTETLISLIENTAEGRWPAMLGGKTWKLSSAFVSPELKIISLVPAASEELAAFLADTTGDRLFVLAASSGKILAMSDEAISLFKHKDNLFSLFDSSSSGAVQAAINRCLKQKTTPDFLVGYNTGGGNRSNYTLSMRKLPSPGRLIYCRLSVPSVAVVTRTVNRKSLVGILLEESFCPALTIDSKGIITSMNEIARAVCQQMWGTNPTGSSFFEFVHPDHRKTVELRNEQRKKGFTTTSRFSVKLQPSLTGSEIVTDISVVPIPDSEQFVVFAKTKSSGSGDTVLNEKNTVHPGLMELLTEDGKSFSDILETTADLIGAASAAYVHEGEVITVGDSRSIVRLLDPVQLAASPCGFRDDKIYLHRIHSGFSISHLVFQGIEQNPLNHLSLAILHASSRILAERETSLALRAGHRILTTVKALAESYLKKTEPLEGLLSDLARECRAETAVVFKINASGTVLKGIGASGVVGILPELHIEALNTASWACIRGETAFFAETPEDDLRFSPVFPNSRSELAVPFFKGSTTDGVILLASTETEAFHYVETELIQMMAILFTSPGNNSKNTLDRDSSRDSTVLKQRELEYIIHNISALYSASRSRLDSLKKIPEAPYEVLENTRYLSDSVTRLNYFSRWTLWWLRVSVYNGVPEHKWINPVPLLEKVLNEFRGISVSGNMKLNYLSPKNDIEVCTDGAFVSMIAYSLLMCIAENCRSCERVNLAFDQMEDHWSFRFDTEGGSVPADCLTTSIQPGKKNMAFSLAWKLTEELEGTISTFSNRGKSTKMIVRLKISG
ncbi:MAG: hypothetical protein J7K88_00370 [Candidatus Fermentibacteraceae bacterium]|nr:hypothetical protein [Candidatus Fermentibacteraceae bacterium]